MCIRDRNIDATLRVRIRFAHLLGWILQGHDLGAHFRDIAVRHHKSVAVLTVKDVYKRQVVSPTEVRAQAPSCPTIIKSTIDAS